MWLIGKNDMCRQQIDRFRSETIAHSTRQSPTFGQLSTIKERHEDRLDGRIPTSDWTRRRRENNWPEMWEDLSSLRIDDSIWSRSIVRDVWLEYFERELTTAEVVNNSDHRRDRRGTTPDRHWELTGSRCRRRVMEQFSSMERRAIGVDWGRARSSLRCSSLLDGEITNAGSSRERIG